jgi:hypothetical protein
MKIGFVSMPLSGHLNPMTALARRLQSRGNEVVFFGVPDVEPFARAAGLDFVPYGEKEYPVGSIDKVYSSVAQSHAQGHQLAGDGGERFHLQRSSEVLHRTLPSIRTIRRWTDAGSRRCQ